MLLSILLSFSLIARFAMSVKYRGSVDPSMCDVQSKALIEIAHI